MRSIQNIVASLGRLSGISDLKTAANNYENHQWKDCVVNAFSGAAKATLVFGTLYAANKLYNGLASSFANGTKNFCEDLFAKGFEGTVTCNQFASEHSFEYLSVPGLDQSKYSLVLDESSSGERCTAVLNEAGRKLISLSKNCREVWKISKDYNKVLLWWDWNAKMWY